MIIGDDTGGHPIIQTNHDQISSAIVQDLTPVHINHLFIQQRKVLTPAQTVATRAKWTKNRTTRPRPWKTQPFASRLENSKTEGTLKKTIIIERNSFWREVLYILKQWINHFKSFDLYKSLFSNWKLQSYAKSTSFSFGLIRKEKNTF